MPTLEEEKLESGHAAEIAFVIKKFKELSLEEQGKVFEGLQRFGSNPYYLAAMCRLSGLIKENHQEFVEFINEYFGHPGLFDDYGPSFTSTPGALRLARYFRKHLKKESDSFSIEEIERSEEG